MERHRWPCCVRAGLGRERTEDLLVQTSRVVTQGYDQSGEDDYGVGGTE